MKLELKRFMECERSGADLRGADPVGVVLESWHLAILSTEALPPRPLNTNVGRMAGLIVVMLPD